MWNFGYAYVPRSTETQTDMYGYICVPGPFPGDQDGEKKHS